MSAKEKKDNTVRLSWDRTNGRFTKMANGRRWKSARSLDPKNPNHYRAAVNEFLAWCNQGPVTPPEYARAIEIRRRMIRWHERFEQNQAAADSFNQAIAGIEKMAQKGERLSVFERDPFRGMSSEGRAAWQDRLRMLERTEDAEKDLLTYKRALAEYLEFKSLKVSNGQRSVLDAHLGFFMKCVGDHQPLVSLDARQWEGFWNKLQQNLNEAKWSKKYGNSVLASVRGFFRWCYDTERLESLPRFVSSRIYRIEVPTTKPIPFTKKEVRSILIAATDEQRLVYLLMLNCGMTQKDVSDLRPDEVDLANGTITRKRTKHRHRATERVPTVMYHLWKPTLELLQRSGDFKDERVFSNQRGKPLVQDKRNDSLAAAFLEIREKLVLKKKSLKTFRKTGTTILGQKGSTHRAWRSVYLGNAPADITEKHYDGTDELPEVVTEYIRIELEIPGSAAELHSLKDVAE